MKHGGKPAARVGLVLTQLTYFHVIMKLEKVLGATETDTQHMIS